MSGKVAALLLLLAGAACQRSPRPPADAAPQQREPPPADPNAGTALINTRCVICHSAEYLSQQRLSEPQWRKTVDKMRKFGTPLSDEEAATLVATLTRTWPPDLAPAGFPRVAPPPGALPAP